MVQEAFHNIAKHSGASQATIHLEYQSKAIALEVSDNGQGFYPRSHYPGHLGLKSMRQRVENIGGTFEIHSAPNQGTCLSVRVPM